MALVTANDRTSATYMSVRAAGAAGAHTPERDTSMLENDRTLAQGTGLAKDGSGRVTLELSACRRCTSLQVVKQQLQRQLAHHHQTCLSACAEQREAPPAVLERTIREQRGPAVVWGDVALHHVQAQSCGPLFSLSSCCQTANQTIPLLTPSYGPTDRLSS